MTPTAPQDSGDGVKAIIYGIPVFADGSGIDEEDLDKAVAAIELLLLESKIEELKRFTQHSLDIKQRSIRTRITELQSNLKKGNDHDR